MLSALRKYTTLLFLLLLLLSCERKQKLDNVQESFIDYYEVLNRKDEVKRYIEKRIAISDGLRTDSTFVVKNGERQFEKLAIYKHKKDELYSLDSKNNEHLFLLKKIDTTIIIEYENSILSTRFLGYYDVEVNNKTYKRASKFIVEDLSIDGISTNIYYDVDFKLIKEEFIEGYHSYFKIERINEKPLNFKKDENSSPSK